MQHTQPAGLRAASLPISSGKTTGLSQNPVTGVKGAFQRGSQPSRPPQRRSSQRVVRAAVAERQPTSLVDGLTGAVESGLAKLQRVLQGRPDGFPPGPDGDATIAFLQNPLGFLERNTMTYGGVVGLQLGGELVALVTDPEVAKFVLIDGSSLFLKEGTAFFPNSQLAGNGLLTSDGAQWQRQRQLAGPAFRRAAVDGYAEAMLSGTQRMLDRWQREVAAGRGRMDVYADYNAVTLQITCEALFGSEMPRAQAQKLAEAVKVAFEFFAARAATGFIVPEWLPTADNARYSAAVKELDSTVYTLIAERRAALALSPRSPQDLLENLLLARDESGVGMNDEAARDELMTLLVAGQETSAILLGWCSAMLAAEHQVQAAAAAEVAAVIGTRSPCAADVRQLPYLEAVVLETLRLRPPAYMVGRCASQGVTLNQTGRNFRLPAGATVLISPYILHRNQSAWSSAKYFLPERWLPPNPDQGPEQTDLAAGSGHAGNSQPAYQGAWQPSRERLEGRSVMDQGVAGAGMRAALSGMGPNGAYIPFGAGPRNCIGAGFAMTEAVLMLAAILQQFKLSPSGEDGQFPATDPRITLRPKNVFITLTLR